VFSEKCLMRQKKVISAKHDCMFDNKLSLFMSYGMLLGKPISQLIRWVSLDLPILSIEIL